MHDDFEIGREDLPALRNRFAISPLLDIEIDVGAAGWVGLTPDADHDLRLDVTSAVIARYMGISVTTARKRIRDTPKHAPRDEIIRRLCRFHIRQYDEFYRTIEIRSNAPIGVFAFDLAMIRSRGTLELMLTSARQGFLIEPCLLARSLLEQFAYAMHVFSSDEDQIIFKSKPQALIRLLHTVNPHAGRAYGMLSRLAHYDPMMHYTFIGGDEKNARNEESSTVIQRSWKFKIASLAWIFFILDLKIKVFHHCYGHHDNFSQLSAINHSILKDYDEFFSDVDFPAVSNVRALLS